MHRQNSLKGPGIVLNGLPSKHACIELQISQLKKETTNKHKMRMLNIMLGYTKRCKMVSDELRHSKGLSI